MTAVLLDAGKTNIAPGTALSTTNNTGGGNAQFVAVSGSTITKVVDTSLDQPIQDTAWYNISAQNATAAYLQWATGTLVAATGGGVGCCFMLTNFPSANFQLLRFGNSGSNFIGYNTAGKLYLTVNGVTVYTSTYVVTPGAPFYLSHSSNSSSSAGNSKLGIWDRQGKLLESYSSATNLNTSGITNANGYAGKISASGVSAFLRVTAIRANNDANALVPPPLGKGARGWGIAA